MEHIFIHIWPSWVRVNQISREQTSMGHCHTWCHGIFSKHYSMGHGHTWVTTTTTLRPVTATTAAEKEYHHNLKTGDSHNNSEKGYHHNLNRPDDLNSKTTTKNQTQPLNQQRGSGCGSVGRAAASYTRDPRFIFCCWQILFTTYCI